jgi:5'(3')-deoxyribonucleotidase
MANTFYLDMDGVVADWSKGVSQLLGHEISTDPTARMCDSDWARVLEHPRLFRDLPLMQGADQLVDLARAYRDQLGWELLFLTAIPHLNDVPWAFWDKMLWAQRYWPDIPVHFGPHSYDKQVHCTQGDILVDDRPDNCEQWRAAGGLAFQVTGSLASVRPLLEEDFNRRHSLRNQNLIILDLDQ